MVSVNSTVERNLPVSNSRHTILEAERLQKSYNGIQALKDLSFTLDAGRILGFLGPNGAGKTTAIRILTTILQPDAGHFVVDGIGSEHPDKIRRRIGVLPESQGYPKDITAIDYLTYFARLYGLAAPDARRTAGALLETVGLQHRAKSLVGSYSRGMRQRLGIARALVNEPVIVFLDEPTLGLDPRGQQELLGVVHRIARDRNAAVVLCSHLLSEIESVCDDVVILSVGQVVAKGSVSEVIGQTRGTSLRIHVPLPAVTDAQRVLGALPSVSQVTPRGERTGWLQVELNGASEPVQADDALYNGILEALIQARIPILTFEAEGSRLQEVFLNLTEEAIR